MRTIEVTVRYEVEGVSDEDLPLVEDHLENHAISDFQMREETGFGLPDDIDTDDAEIHILDVKMKTIKELWEDDAIQFPRLIAEIAATDALSSENVWAELCDSMDLTDSELNVLFDRAEAAWEAAKKAVQG